MTDFTTVDWYPPQGGSPIRFGHDWPYRITRLEGLTVALASPVSIKSPSQVGVTAVDVDVPPRIVTMQIVVAADDQAELWELRRELARAFAIVPADSGSQIASGRLVVNRPGLDPLELAAIPRQSPREAATMRGFTMGMDIEWEAAYPFWKETADTLQTFQADGGFVFPVTLPLAMESYNVVQEVDNQGDVAAPLVARLFGEADTVRIINSTTGKTLEITGVIDAGDYVEISTAFGDKRVELVEADGTRTSIMDRVNLALADFWSLEPGINVVTFEADTNTSGRVVLYWRQRYVGI